MLLPQPDSPRGSDQQRTGRWGKKGVLLLGPQSLKGVALVQLSQCTWFLVMMRVFFEGSVENLAATRLDVLFIVHTIDSAFTTGRI